MEILVKDYGIEDIVRELRDIKSRVYDSEVETLIDKLISSYDENCAISNGYEGSAMRILGELIAQDIKEHDSYLYYVTVYETSGVWYNPENGCIFTDVEDRQGDDFICISLVAKVDEHIAEKYIDQIYTGKQEKACPCVRYYDIDYNGGLDAEIAIYFAELVEAIETELKRYN